MSSQYPDSGTRSSPLVTSPPPPSTSQETKTHQTLPKQDQSAEEDSTGDPQKKNKRIRTDKLDQSVEEENPTGDTQKNKRIRTDKQDQKPQQEENAVQEKCDGSVPEEKMPQNENPTEENTNQENPTGGEAQNEVQEQSDDSVPEERMPQQENPIEENPNQGDPIGGEAQNAGQEQFDDSVPEEKLPQEENPIEENPIQETPTREAQFSENESQEVTSAYVPREEHSVDDSSSSEEENSEEETPSSEFESADEEYDANQEIILFPEDPYRDEVRDDIKILDRILKCKSEDKDLPTFSINENSEPTLEEMVLLLNHMTRLWPEHIGRVRLRNKILKLMNTYRTILQEMGPDPLASEFRTPYLKRRFELLKMVFKT